MHLMPGPPLSDLQPGCLQGCAQSPWRLPRSGRTPLVESETEFASGHVAEPIVRLPSNPPWQLALAMMRRSPAGTTVLHYRF